MDDDLGANFSLSFGIYENRIAQIYDRVVRTILDSDNCAECLRKLKQEFEGFELAIACYALGKFEVYLNLTSENTEFLGYEQETATMLRAAFEITAYEVAKEKREHN